MAKPLVGKYYRFGASDCCIAFSLIGKVDSVDEDDDGEGGTVFLEDGSSIYVLSWDKLIATKP